MADAESRRSVNRPVFAIRVHFQRSSASSQTAHDAVSVWTISTLGQEIYSVMSQQTVIALDLEGTLISNAVSQFARPGLFAFLEFCRDRFSSVYLYTAVRDARCHEIVYNLVSRDLAPDWLSDVSFVQWDHDLKDLRNISGVQPADCLIVDDNRDYIVESQLSQWIEVKKFEPPYPDDDRELERVQREIERRLSAE